LSGFGAEGGGIPGFGEAPSAPAGFSLPGTSAPAIERTEPSDQPSTPPDDQPGTQPGGQAGAQSSGQSGSQDSAGGVGFVNPGSAVGQPGQNPG
jgi:hypothetical protein